MKSIVVTGAGGFVGRLLVPLLLDKGWDVIGIGRSPEPFDWPQEAKWVRADLANPAEYQPKLSGVNCVVHLAAVTGKATPAAYRHGNVETTRSLIECSVAADVQRFVFVSSIAAKFANRQHYHYADTKIAAEQLVRAAPLQSVIVRPTMILGEGSPIEDSLAMLAGLPLSPIFGNGQNRVQPIDVQDVANALAALAGAQEIADETIELGGPEIYNLRELYDRLRTARGASSSPRIVRLPLGFFRAILGFVEKPLLPLLPLTAGQLATFANDGLAEPHAAHASLPRIERDAPRKSVEPADTPPSPPKPPSSDKELSREFIKHARYIAGVEPTVYQVDKYIEFRRDTPLAARNRFDAFLLRISRLGGIGLALSDAYSGLLYRRAVLRARLVLALAILEVSAPTYAKLDAPEARGRWSLLVLAFRGTMTGISVLIAAILLLPAQILLSRRTD